MDFKDKKYFMNKIKEIEQIKTIYLMKTFIQHGNTTTYTHCLHVAYVVYYICKKYKLKVDIDSVIRGAFLHDFYLYDWHEHSSEHRLHGFSHSRKALINAKKYFSDLNNIEKNMIYSHMWPLNISRIPKYKEAWLLMLVDKYCSTIETFKYK